MAKLQQDGGCAVRQCERARAADVLRLVFDLAYLHAAGLPGIELSQQHVDLLRLSALRPVGAFDV